jgi:hypothetical protein
LRANFSLKAIEKKNTMELVKKFLKTFKFKLLTCTHKRFLIIWVFGKGIISWLLNFTLDFFNIMAVKYPSS